MSHAAVLADLQAGADPIRAAGLARFFQTGPGQYGAGDRFLGLTLPQQREIARRHRQLPLTEVSTLLRSPWHEARLTALIIWTLQFPKAGAAGQQAIVASYLSQREQVNNWDLVDSSAPQLLGAYLLTRDRAPLYELAASGHLWSQRMSLVATLAFIRKNQLQDTFALAERLLGHPHSLIHKATGWMLREVGKRNEESLEEFLTDHRGQLPRTALRYAIERLPPARRAWHLS